MKLSFSLFVAFSLAAPSSASLASPQRRRGLSSSSEEGCENDPASPGPFPVGYRAPDQNTGLGFALVSGRKSFDTPVLPFTVWHPAAPAGDEDDATVALPGFEAFAYALRGAVVNPPIADSSGESGSCFPLVISSHGSGGNSLDYHELHVQLASYGFVVAAPTHLGNSVTDLLGALTALLGQLQSGDLTLDQVLLTLQQQNTASLNPASEVVQNSAFDRPRDVMAVVDAVLGGAAGPDIAASVCADRIAVIGHSFGGFAALAAANGYDPIDASFETFTADGRIKAAAAMAPAVREIFSADAGSGKLTDLISSDVPTLVLSGTKDLVRTPIATNTVPLWDTIKCSTEETYRVDLVDAGHTIYTDVCYLAFVALGPPVAGAFGETVETFPAFCASLLNPETFDPATPSGAILACIVVGQLLAETADAGCIPGAGFLPSAVGKPAIYTYVVSYLKSTVGGDGDDEECFEDYLEEGYATLEGLPVDPATLFL